MTHAELLLLAATLCGPYDLARTCQAILAVESNVGRSNLVGDRNLPVGERSYGVMQVRVIAVRHVLSRWPELWAGEPADEEIIARLLTDPTWNITVAVHYLRLMRDGVGWRQSLCRYNQGPDAPADCGYARRVIESLPLNPPTLPPS